MRVDELTGATIGRYRVGGRLQVLPYASVHRATALAEGRSVLMWTFREPYASAAGFLEALQQLAGDRRTAQVPGVLPVLEIGFQELRAPVVYLTTNDAPNGFLVSLLQSGRAPGVFAITGPLARAVDGMHKLGMIHGDVQPATVAVGGEGAVLVGHAVRTVVSRVTPQAPWVDVTRAFRPPEAPSSAEPTRASDLWGLAALVYYLLVGRPPSADGWPDPPSQLRPQIPPRVDQTVMRALSTDPAERYPTAAEFFAALRGAPMPGSAPRPAPPGPPPAPDDAAGQASSRWPIEAPLTPASMRAASLPTNASSDPGTETRTPEPVTHLIPLEPYGVRRGMRRGVGMVLMSLLVAGVVAVLALLATGHL
ncbi:MAG: serine/threonine protein kinase [Candidatus Dormibacteria bacterium]